MAFKLRSPLHTYNPYRAKSKAIVAAHAKAVADYKPGSKANPTYGTAENIKEADLKEKGKRTNLPSEKPKLTKAKSNLPASQGGSPFYGIGQAAAQRDKSNAQEGKGTYKFENNKKSKTNLRLPRFSVSKYMEAPAGTKFAAAASGKTSSFPSKITSTTGGASNLDFSKGDIIGQYGKGKSKTTAPYKPGDGVMTRDAEKNNAERIKNKPKNTVKPSSNTNTSTSTTKSSNTTTKLSTGSNTNAGKSGGYLKDTKNFSLGVDTKLNVAPMPKFERTVTNARSADYDMIRAKGRGKIDRLKTRLDRREGRVANRVEASSMRIKSRQKRSGNRYASKMEARTNTGTNPGYSTEQKKLDAFEKSMDSPKATPRTSGAGNISSGSKMPSLRTPKSNQTVAKPSVKLNTSRQTSITIDDNKIKSGAKQAKGGRINEKVSAKTYKSLRGSAKLNKKAGPSGGMQRGMTRVDQTKKLTSLASGNQPRKDVKNMSSKNYLNKGIKPSYKK